MSKSLEVIGILALVGLLGSGCATITRGTKDLLVVESEPPGAQVTLSNGMSGKTPTSFKLPRKEAVVVKIEKDGYEMVEVSVRPHISGAGGLGWLGMCLWEDSSEQPSMRVRAQ